MDVEVPKVQTDEFIKELCAWGEYSLKEDFCCIPLAAPVPEGMAMDDPRVPWRARFVFRSKEDAALFRLFHG